MGLAFLPLAGTKHIAGLIQSDLGYGGVSANTAVLDESHPLLHEETHRVAVTTTFLTHNILQIRIFFTNSNMPATVEQFGLFDNSTATVNQPVLLAAVNHQFVKGSADLLVVFQITVNTVTVPEP